MRLYEIWSEGFRATGESGGAVFHGKSKGNSFQDACDRFAEVVPEFRNYYDPARMTYWGCKLFDNEAEARINFG